MVKLDEIQAAFCSRHYAPIAAFRRTLQSNYEYAAAHPRLLVEADPPPPAFPDRSRRIGRRRDPRATTTSTVGRLAKTSESLHGEDAMSELEIKVVRSEDLTWVVEMFTRQVYPDDPDGAHLHFADHAAGGAATFLAFVQSELAGYITIRWQSNNPLVRRENIPLIHDLLVFPAFRRRGIASRLMNEAETLIATRASKAGITVGLFDAYGPAQRLFVRQGYLPDGRGVCRAQRPLQKGEAVRMDHDVILWLTKDLSVGKPPLAGTACGSQVSVR
jgi:GNAT superfamily N-acetyltransferase